MISTEVHETQMDSRYSKEMPAPGTELKPVHLLSVGAFGHAVGDYLKTFRSDIEVTSVRNNVIPLPETWPDSRVNVVAAWRAVPTLCELLDQLSHKWLRPFVPLILDSPVLRLGPIVSPGNGCCWNCWIRRRRQHATWPDEQLALTEHYAAHAESGPRGYLEPFAMMGAARIAHAIDALDALDSSAPIAGHVWQIDLVTRKVTCSTVVGIHDCARCGLHRLAATRSFAEMQHALARLWTNLAAEEQ